MMQKHQKRRGTRGGVGRQHRRLGGETTTHRRYADLIAQFDGCYKQLVGRAVMVVLPGGKCTHPPAGEFRPLHREMPRWRARPEIHVLHVGPERMTLGVIESAVVAGKLHYGPAPDPRTGAPRAYDFYQTPRAGGWGNVLDSAAHPVVFTIGCNLLQELINTADRPAGQLFLPRLMILTNHVKPDDAKIAAIAETISPELADRETFCQRRREEAGVISLGQLFGDAEVMSDEDIFNAFAERRAYEDYSALLGAEYVNPARKILLAGNPARQVITDAGLPNDWAATADGDLVSRLIAEMRARVPLSERMLDSDVIDALEKPQQPLHFSVPMEKVPAGAIVAAMRATFPAGAAIGHVVSDDDLLEAARKPYAPLVVRAYARPQVFEAAAVKLPSYAAGSLLPQLPEPRGHVDLTT